MPSTYSYAQLEGLWINNGGSKATAPVAAAIAEAESSGRAAVTSANPDGGVNVGLWQLDTRGKGAGYSVQQLSDPATNAAVAVRASKNGTDWSAWETYVTGAYKRFMSGSTTPDLNQPVSTTAAQAAAQQQASAGAECAFSIGGQHIGILFGHGPSLPSACLISKSEVRAIVGGLVLFAGALVMLPGIVILAAYGFRATQTGQAIMGAAETALPGYGRVASAVAGGGRAAGRMAGRGRGRPRGRPGSGGGGSSRRRETTSAVGSDLEQEKTRAAAKPAKPRVRVVYADRPQ